MKRKTVCVPHAILRTMNMLLILIMLAFPSWAQRPTADEYYTQAQAAIDSENYDNALRLLEKAKKDYPDRQLFPTMLGDLYSEKEFHSLALEEFTIARRLAPDDPDLLYRVSVTLGKLNREKESIAVLERLLGLKGDDVQAIGDLGWMYFKVHQLKKGEKLLLNAISRFGLNTNFAMTLGTIYSEEYEYGKARSYYLLSIKDALKTGSQNSVAVAYYNLALLEEKYYHFPQAMEYAEKSVSHDERPSGHLAKGELYLRQQNIQAAYIEFQRAYNLDTSPLSRINLANILSLSGRVKESQRYLASVMESSNLSWLFNYGTDLASHYRDLHDLYRANYSGLANLELAQAAPDLFSRIRSLSRAAGFRILSWYHTQRYKSYSKDIARILLAENNTLNAMLSYYRAYDGYPAIAAKYLIRAQNFEAALIPDVIPSYNLEQALLENNEKAIRLSLDSLDPVWERDAIARALDATAAIAEKRGDRETYRNASERLFSINPGIMLQRGIGLSLILRIESTKAGDARKLEHRFASCFERAFSLVASGGETTLWRYRFSGRLDATTFAWKLVDTATGAVLKNEKAQLASLSNRDTAALFNTILEKIYQTE
jgi:tetratricopeptide (TPR) repeat protein